MKDCRDDGRLALSQRQLQRLPTALRAEGEAEDFNGFCQMGPFERMSISRELYNLARREMNDLARVSGGRSFVAATLADARAAFARVAADIGTLYSIGYYPTNKTRDGKYRAIKLEVRGVKDKAQVRARDGYYAPKRIDLVLWSLVYEGWTKNKTKDLRPTPMPNPFQPSRTNRSRWCRNWRNA